MGAECLFLTNACGAINTTFSAGDFMLLRDHMSVWRTVALIGRNIEELARGFRI